MNNNQRNDALSVFGNTNYLDGFIYHLEAQIELREEFKRPLNEAPNYYAWLSMTSERIFYRIREVHFSKYKDNEVFDHQYKKLLDSLFNDIDFHREQKESIILFAKIRHILVHKGFPNPHIVPAGNLRPITKGVVLTPEETKEVCEYLFNTSNFNTLKAKYTAITKELKSHLLPVIWYG